MTAADQLHLEGCTEATYKLVKGALKLGMDTETIADTFEMDVKEVQMIIHALRKKEG